jgi:hypothetical protein
MYDPPFELPPTMVGEHLSDIASVVSDEVSAKLGLRLLDTFLRALGGWELTNKVRFSYEAEKTEVVKFRFDHATRDYLKSLVLLGAYLMRKKLREDFPYVQKGLRFYLVSGVVRTHSISIIGEDKKRKAVNSEVIALKIAGLSGDVSVKKSAKGEVTFSGKRKLAFGVELHELQYNPKTSRMTLRMPPSNYIPVRGDKSPGKVPYAFIGGLEDDVFLNIVEK